MRELVQEIVEGDFDQIEVYAAKLPVLESFIAEQTRGRRAGQTAARPRCSTSKESELRLQQRYMQQLQSALKPLPVPTYLRDFLAQVWSQALMRAVRRDGADVRPRAAPAPRRRATWS